MRSLLRVFVTTSIVFFSLAVQAQLGREVIVSGLNFPMHVAAPPGDAGRLFVAERAGVIRVLNLSSGAILPAAFLDISSRVDQDGEGALFSIAFHPQFETNGHFFICYTTDINPEVGFALGVRVSRFTISADPNVADATSEVPFLEISKPTDIHNGGMLAFKPNDPNHYLYVSVGDGGPRCDPGRRAQDRGDKRGKILRLDVDAGPSGDVDAPFVPASNPYVNASGDDAVWVLGLRNPYRFSFDRLTGAMYIGDVGQEAREEISVVPGNSAGGENFGWSALEGTIQPPNCTFTPPPDSDMVAPIHEYDHGGEGAAVTGGHVYRGLDYADIFGRYFFADFVTGQIWSFRRAGPGITDLQEHTSILNPNLSFITSFGEDAAGNIYIVELQGTVARIVSPVPPPPDIDQDLLPNEYEDNTGIFISPTQTGTDPLDFDTDDDGVWDGIEVELGTDPNDPLDVPDVPANWIWTLGVAVMLLICGSLFAVRRRPA